VKSHGLKIVRITNTKMNMRTELFEKYLINRNFSRFSNWGAYSF